MKRAESFLTMTVGGLVLVSLSLCACAKTTPESTVTPRPTVIALALHATPVEIPADWMTYEDPTNEFTLRHPPDWTMRTQKSGGVTFDFSVPGVVIIDVCPGRSTGVPGDEKTINSLARIGLDNQSSGESAQLLGKGIWPYFATCNYAEVGTYSRTDRHYVDMVETDCLIGSGSSIVASISRWRTALSSSEANPQLLTMPELEDFGMVLESVRIK